MGTADCRKVKGEGVSPHVVTLLGPPSSDHEPPCSDLRRNPPRSDLSRPAPRDSECTHSCTGTLRRVVYLRGSAVRWIILLHLGIRREPAR
eukprot:1042208-Prymnesium_polylepis.1